PADPQQLEPLMRAAHSIKGAARIVNIDAAVQLAHVMEDAFVAAQEGRLRITPADIDGLFRGTDLLSGLGQVAEDEVAAWSTQHAAETADLKDLSRRLAQGQPAPPPAAPSPSPPRPTPRPQFFVPRESLLSGDDPSMTDLFREEVRAASVVLSDGLVRL